MVASILDIHTKFYENLLSISAEFVSEDQRFANFFGHGTLFNLSNIYGTHRFCGPSFTT